MAETGIETSQKDATVESAESTDYETLYKAEVGNAKKLRKRAQEVEKQLDNMTATIKANEEQKMIEDGKLQEAYDSLKVEFNSLKKQNEESQSIVTKARQDLLDKVPEEEREALEPLPFDTLKLVVGKMTTIPAAQLPNTTPGVKQLVPDKPYAQMNEQERRAYHASKV